MTSVLGAEYYNTADSGLIAYWRFDEAEGETAYDRSIYGNHGEIRGAIFTDMTAPLSIANYTAIQPGKFQLFQNYPNPFNPSTTIEFTIPKTEFVTVKIYNLLGQEVTTLVSQTLKAGFYNYGWNASDLSSGIYYYTLTAGEFQDVKKMVLLR
jgi:hypothetical protein